MKKSKYSEEQIVRILKEAASGQKTQAQACHDHGISANTFYVWRRKNAQLKRLLAEPALSFPDTSFP